MRTSSGFLFGAAFLATLTAPVQAQDKSDQLPRGAIFRLGTTAFQSDQPIAGLVVLPGGKQAVTANADGLTLWDLATGTRVASAAKPAEAKVADTPRRGFGTTLPRTITQLTTSPLRFVNQHNGSLAALPDGRSVIWWNKGGFSEPGGYQSFSLPFDGKAPRTLASTGFGSRANLPSGIVVAAGEPFALSEKGRLMSFQQDRPGWTEIRRTPPIAGDRLAIAAGGSIVAYGGEDERIRLWDAANGKALPPINTGAVQALAVSGDGKRVAAIVNSAGLPPYLIQVWDVAARKQLSRWITFSDRIALSTSGDRLASVTTRLRASRASTIEIYDTGSGQQVNSFSMSNDSISVLEFASGESLIAAGQDGIVHVLDLSAAAPQGKKTARSAVVATSFLPDGGVATAGKDGYVRVWGGNGKEARRFLAEDTGLAAMLLAPDGKTLYTGSRSIPDKRGGKIRVVAWDLATGNQLREYSAILEKNLNGSVPGLSSHGKLLAVGLKPGGVHILRLDSFQRTSFLEKKLVLGAVEGVDAIGFAANGRLVSLYGPTATIWDLALERALHSVKELADDSRFGPENRSSLAVSPDGTQFAASYAAPRARVAQGFGDIPFLRNPRTQIGHSLGIWSTETGKLLDSFELSQAAPLLSLAFHPKGGLVAVGDSSGKVWLVDVATKAVPKLLDGHSGPVLSLAFSKDGKRLVSGSADTTAIVWKIEY